MLPKVLRREDHSSRKVEIFYSAGSSNVQLRQHLGEHLEFSSNVEGRACVHATCHFRRYFNVTISSDDGSYHTSITSEKVRNERSISVVENCFKSKL